MFQLAVILTIFDTYACLFHFTFMHLLYQEQKSNWKVPHIGDYLDIYGINPAL